MTPFFTDEIILFTRFLSFPNNFPLATPPSLSLSHRVALYPVCVIPHFLGITY